MKLISLRKIHHSILNNNLKNSLESKCSVLLLYLFTQYNNEEFLLLDYAFNN